MEFEQSANTFIYWLVVGSGKCGVAPAQLRHVVEEFVHHELQQNTLGPQAGLSLALPAPSITTLRFSFYGTIASFLLT